MALLTTMLASITSPDSGDVSGPASSTDNQIVRFDGTDGKTIQTSAGVISDAGALSGLSAINGLTGLTASRALQTDASKNLESSATTTTELGYLSGVTSAIQTQIDTKSWQLIATATASDSASVAFTGLSSTYFAYKIIVQGYRAADDITNILVRTSTDNGSSYDSGASDYGWVFTRVSYNTSPVTSLGGDEADTAIRLITGVGNAANEVSDFEVTIYNPSDTQYTSIDWHGKSTNEGLGFFYFAGSGTRLAAADVDAVQFLQSGGNIAAGNFRLYGIRAS